MGLLALSTVPAADCRKQASFFQGRYSACYKAEFYNQAVRGGWTLLVALNKKGEYNFVESSREIKPLPPVR